MIAAVTSATIALSLAQQMATTHQPNTGLLQPGSTIAAAGVVQEWTSNDPEAIDFFDMPAMDARSSGNWDTNLVSPFAIGCTLAGMSFLCSRGMTLESIAAAVEVNPYLELGSLYSDAGQPMWTDFMAAMKPIWAAEAPTNAVTPNDPFNAWLPPPPVAVPVSEQIYDLVVRDFTNGVPKAVTVIKIENLITPQAFPC
jgi:hypothetical protein